jgi:plasmid stabilization system protein ParE
MAARHINCSTYIQDSVRRSTYFGGTIMPRGDKSKYTDKQKRKAEHIEEGYKDAGVPEKEAERRAWATVNKESGGGKKSGSGRGKKESHASSRKGGTLGGAASAARPASARSAAAKQAAATRARRRRAGAYSR